MTPGGELRCAAGNCGAPPAVGFCTVDAGAKALWLQLGIMSDDARKIAESAGLDYVEDHCMGVERDRFGVDKRSA